MKHMKLSGIVGALFAAMLVCGCGTSAPVRYYGLVPVESASAFTVADDFALSVGPIRMAEYLNRSQIVTRGEGVDMEFGEYDRWTEPLGRSFERTLTDNLAALLDSDRILDFPASAELAKGYQLPAQVTRFDAESSGLAVLEVQWLVKDVDDSRILPARRSRYTTPVTDSDDYGSVVRALSELVGLFARDVATELAKLP